MAQRHYRSAERIGDVVILRFDGANDLSVTVPFDDMRCLCADLANITRKAHQLQTVQPKRIEKALLEGLDSETRVVRKVHSVDVDPPPLDATQPTILRISAGTETGPMTLRISQIAAVELARELNRLPLTRGSA